MGVHLYSLESQAWLKTFPEIDTTIRNQITCCAWAGYTAAIWTLWKFEWTSVRNQTGSDIKEATYHYQFWQLWAVYIEMSRFYPRENFFFRSLWNIQFCHVRIHIPYMPALNWILSNIISYFTFLGMFLNFRDHDCEFWLMLITVFFDR